MFTKYLLNTFLYQGPFDC